MYFNYKFKVDNSEFYCKFVSRIGKAIEIVLKYDFLPIDYKMNFSLIR